MFDLSWREAETVAVVALDNPPANAMGLDQVSELEDLLGGLAKMARLRAVIFRSQHRFFSAGADISLMASALAHGDGAKRMAELASRMQAAFLQLERLPVPVFAAISGICVGGGLELALACDFRIAERASTMGLPEVKIGLLPGAGGTQRLSAIAGRGTATRLIMTGELVTGAVAFDLGIIHEVTDDGQAFERTLELARSVTAAPQRSLASIKACLSLAPSAAGFEAEIAQTRQLFAETETRDLIGAFLARTQTKRT